MFIAPLAGKAKENLVVQSTRWLDGSNKYVFSDRNYKVLSKVLFSKNLDFLTREEETFIRNYIKEADIVTKEYKNGNVNAYSDMSDMMKQYDKFIGSLVKEVKYE